jgi:hypothetical protein
MIEFRAFHDIAGTYVSPDAKRRHVVLRFKDGKLCWMTAAFSTMAAASRRAKECNAAEAADRAKAAA